MPLTRRKPLRIQRYDYATPGAYFVTVGGYQRQMLFEDEALAEIVRKSWLDLPRRFPDIKLDEFVIMPNHFHGIIWLGVGAPLAGARRERTGANPATSTGIASPRSGSQRGRAGASPAPTLGDVIGAFKSIISVQWLQLIKTVDPSRSAKIWQRNYYEHVIRDEDELRRVREYIRTNPLKWQLDRENPEHVPNSGHERDWRWLEGIAAHA